LLAQPQTFMNRSGYSVRCLCERYGIAPASTLVVFDDVALPFGRLRLRGSGGAGGHRGMESVIDNLRTDEVPRLRLGISPPPADADAAPAAPTVDLAEFVLAPFSPAEQGPAEELVARAADAIELWLAEGLAAAANRYNTGDLPVAERLV
jgi:PTH1 family peptidyl-tRNA hydrolase